MKRKEGREKSKRRKSGYRQAASKANQSRKASIGEERQIKRATKRRRAGSRRTSTRDSHEISVRRRAKRMMKRREEKKRRETSALRSLITLLLAHVPRIRICHISPVYYILPCMARSMSCLVWHTAALAYLRVIPFRTCLYHILYAAATLACRK